MVCVIITKNLKKVILINMGVIYLRTNLVNGMQYVGQSNNMYRRNRNWNNINWYYANQLLTDDRKKYGLDNFKTMILQECDTQKELDRWEKHYIKFFNTVYPNGYNDNEGGSIGYHHSERTKQKISNTEKGKFVSEETKLKIAKPIVQINERGEIIFWNSAKECSENGEYNYSVKNISAVCHKHKKTHLNSKFYFKDEYLKMLEEA